MSKDGDGARPDSRGKERKPLVLVVDDHEDTRFLLKTILDIRGAEVLEASDGEEAIEMAERERPDLVLMDAGLPRLDGLAATRRMRECASLCRVKIIFLSGQSQSAFRAVAFEAGCDDFLVKPFDLNQLDGVLDKHLPQ